MANHRKIAGASSANSTEDDGLNEDGSDTSDDKTKPLSGQAPSADKTQDNEEVVRFSHVGSIVVKDAGTDNGESHRRSTSPLSETMGRGGNRGRIASRNHADDGDDGSSASDCAPMDDIVKSPYEPDLNAEKGVKVFADMKKLLSDNSHDNYRSVDPKAAKIFGPTNAWCLVKANALIEKSGMVYSQEWMHGNVRGNAIGKIPKDLLLLCLVAKRFEKAGDSLLSGLVRDLEVYKTIKEALKEWNLKNQFKKISSTAKNFMFSTKKRDCYKCVIFVARAYGCLKAFGMDCMDDSLMTKITACLRIMESHIMQKGDAASAKKRKSAASDPPLSDVTPTPKRRRGRIPKSEMNSAATLAEETRSAAAAAEAGENSSESGSDEPESEPLPRHTASSNTSTQRGRKSNGKKESLVKLVERFEEQYRDLGQKYDQMGETLEKLRARINESRASTEREIRSELLQEVQKTLMKK